MKVCLAQINTTPGDFSGNYESIQLGVKYASENRCDLVVFPELTIPGYLSQDLFYNPEFIETNFSALQKLVDLSRSMSPGLHIVVGYVGRNEAVGKPFTNMAAVISEGRMVGTYQKQLLPFYDVFDELRYFEAGSTLNVVEING
ncbi:MAG: NAD+ synthase, partial [Gammaproteobacteria bacterium]|nr:NAD+ synthase [Gammaproteobacteria bacterium]